PYHDQLVGGRDPAELAGDPRALEDQAEGRRRRVRRDLRGHRRAEPQRARGREGGVVEGDEAGAQNGGGRVEEAPGQEARLQVLWVREEREVQLTGDESAGEEFGGLEEGVPEAVLLALDESAAGCADTRRYQGDPLDRLPPQGYQAGESGGGKGGEKIFL